MVNSKTQPRGTRRWVHRTEKYGRSLLAGASGFIFVNHYPAYGPATGGIGSNDEGLIPGISLSYEDGALPPAADPAQGRRARAHHAAPTVPSR